MPSLFLYFGIGGDHVLVAISQINPEPVQWLWRPWIPLGAVTLLDGDGGTRKTTLALNVAAAVSRGGPMFDGSAVEHGGVLVLSQEDSVAATLRPRLEAMDANLDRILGFAGESITLHGHLDRIEQTVMGHGVSLIVIDPLSGFLGTDSNREQNVRRVLARLADVAERRRVAILCIRHLTKSRGVAQQAGVGSVAIGAVARSGLILGRNPSDSSRVVLAHYKSNLALAAASLDIQFEGVRAELIGESPLGPGDLLSPQSPNPGTALAEAIEFLQSVLARGALNNLTVRKLASDAGIAGRTLRKAKDVLRVRSFKQEGTFVGPWYWALHDDDRIANEDDLLEGQLRSGRAAGDEPDPENPDMGAWFLDHLIDAPEDDPRDKGHLRRPNRDEDHPRRRSAGKARRKRGSASESRDVEEELSALVGLAGVKEQLLRIRDVVEIHARRKKLGLPPSQLSLHAVFRGNPGTGKTVVARLYSALLAKHGWLPRGHLVEVDRSQLVGEYVGQTAPKTLAALQSALGGVLFVDEAYTLKQDERDSFGQECIDTLLKFMEDHREKLVVVLAGYREKMENLLSTNPGFRSRFLQYLDFPDYDDDALLEIFRRMIKPLPYDVAPPAEQIVIESLRRERERGDFGNARSVRNLIQRAVLRQSARLAELARGGTCLTRDHLVQLEPEDLLHDDAVAA